ncbi:MAG: ABC transporter substrate-binding protein [Alphaproteobacteria bacterium]|nr:ABC transporter substrate-binding protein [Alphaproteobacteria bacterium]
MSNRRAIAAATALVLSAAAPAAAQTLTVGLGSEPSALDPHYHNLGPNNAMARHLFDTLILQDERQRLTPGLALSWKPLDDTTWEFKLRPNVKFHDGTAFAASDVAFTLKRAPDVPRSPASFGIYIKPITGVEIVDPLTIRFKTAAPYPLLPNDISTVAIVSQKHGENATTEDYNSCKAAVGTGPYKCVERVAGDRVVMARNDAYWGGAQPWQRVVFKPIKSAPTRVAALLAGDVDLIDDAPTADIERLKKDARLSVVQGVSNRVIYLHLDSDRAESPGIADKQGNPLKANPFKDPKVRKALSKAINRPAIVDRVMEGVAIPAGQLLPDGFFGVSSKLRVEPFDPEGARKLLAEAGYPNGFRVTLATPNDRYINDEKIAQAIAQMLTRIGIETKVDAMPGAVYFGRASKLEFSLMLVGWGSGTGEASSPLKSLLASFDQAKGMGAANRGRYSNPQMDRLLERALATVDDKGREALLQQATEVAIGDLGIVPLHFQVNTWAMKKAVKYDARTDEATLATGIKRAN